MLLTNVCVIATIVHEIFDIWLHSYIYVILLQVELVAMETCIAKGMELTQQPLALHCSTMA